MSLSTSTVSRIETNTSDDELAFNYGPCHHSHNCQSDGLDSGLADTPASVSENEEGCQPAYSETAPIVNQTGIDFSSQLGGNSASTFPTKHEHPLAHNWSLYFRANKEKTASWEELHDKHSKIATISTIEAFWQVFNHLIVPSRMKKRISPNLIFFRDDIQPSWEDPENLNGGMWGLVLREQKGLQRGRLLDQIWFETVLACIGETLTNGELITGVIVQRRAKEDRIQLWTRNAADSDIAQLGQHFKSLLNLGCEVEICYTKHADMSAISRSARKEQQHMSHSNQLDRIERLRI